MTSNFYKTYMNLPLVAVFAVLSLSVSALVSLVSSTPSSAANYPYHPMSVRDDRCYSSLNSVSRVSGLLGQPNFGMVNAIMNAPIYDWDQGDSLSSNYASYTMYNLLGSQRGVFSGLRGSLDGYSVGYAKDFRFRVTPVPNLQWMFKYFALQLPNDFGKAAWFTGAPNPVNTVDGSRGRPYIANPFIYMQSALIQPNGIPQFQALTGPFNDLAAASRGETSVESAVGLDSLKDITDFKNYQIRESEVFMSSIFKDQQKTGNGIQDAINSFANLTSAGLSDIKNVEAASENMLGQIAGLPIIKNIGSYPYNIRGDNPYDNCYESLTSSNQVPSYAFSVPGTAIPVTIPGWIFSIFTMLDGKGPSSSGMTAYLGGSINGKAMLDCYGRGVTPMVTGHDRLKIKDWPATYAEGFSTGLMNMTIFFLIQSAAIAADIAAPGSGNSIRAIGTSVPAITTKFETYTSGFAFLFRIEKESVVLPDYLQNRAVDYRTLSGTNSKMSDINIYYALGGLGHDQSQNGQQFNPDVYLKLYRPYVVNPEFDIRGTNTRQSLDGSSVSVYIKTTKHGFNAGNTATSVGGTNYTEDKSATGGPTYDVNAEPKGSGRSFTDARVYKMVIKPGTIVNAIDQSKIIKDGPAKDHYSSVSSPSVNASTDPCSFFAQQLRTGDSGAKPSRLTTDGSNANNSLPNAPSIDSRSLGQDANFTCGEVANKQLKMDQEQSSLDLYGTSENREIVKIPAETPPGTKICFAVYYTNYTNDIKTRGNPWWDGRQNNYNENYETPNDKTFLSRANCIISGYKPSLQVRGGDLMTNGGVYTGTNVKEFLSSTATPQEVRTYGSWVEYGIIAKDSVNQMASGGLYRIGMPSAYRNFGYLTFANEQTSSGPNQGHYPGTSEEAGNIDDGFERVTRQFTSMSEQAQIRQPVDSDGDGNPDPIDLATLPSGVYRLRGAQINLTASAPLPERRSLILLVDQLSSGTVPTVNISGNVQIPVDYGEGSSVSDISQVVIAPSSESGEYRLNIGHAASQVDAWLLNPNGTINTCYTGLPTNDVQNTPRAGSMCNAPLTVNGPVSAKNLLLRRDGGKDQSDAPPIAQSIPGENFNLRPDAYIWSAHYVDAGGSKYVTTNSVDLPPRY